MPRIRCLYLDCNFLDDNYCTAVKVEIDPDMGCATYLPVGEGDLLDDDEWDTEDDDEYAGWDTEDIDEDFSDDDEDDW